MAKESSQHKGHRQRMRARVEQYGLESLEPHEALEYVLYITNTRKDTNGLAHVLMDRFGDFAGVLDASEEDLLTVEGVGPSTARMLHLLPQVGRYYTQCAVNGKKCMKTTDQLVEYLMAQFAGTVQERALLAALDAAGMSADVTRIEFADVDEMAFLYQDRISVWLGTLNELEYKLKLAKHVLLNEDGKGCAATDTGKLDFTHISMSSTRKFTFAQGEPELPSGRCGFAGQKALTKVHRAVCGEEKALLRKCNNPL